MHPGVTTSGWLISVTVLLCQWRPEYADSQHFFPARDGAEQNNFLMKFRLCNIHRWRFIEQYVKIWLLLSPLCVFVTCWAMLQGHALWGEARNKIIPYRRCKAVTDLAALGRMLLQVVLCDLVHSMKTAPSRKQSSFKIYHSGLKDSWIAKWPALHSKPLHFECTQNVMSVFKPQSTR